MFEELEKPMEIWTSNYWLKEAEEEIINKYGEETMQKIKHIRDEYFNTDAVNSYDNEEIRMNKAKEDFLQKHPNTSNNVLEMLSLSFYHAFILH